jgi:hypothetical protein
VVLGGRKRGPSVLSLVVHLISLDFKEIVRYTR